MNHGSHQPCLGSLSLVAADSLRPLEFDFLCRWIVEIPPIGYRMRAQGIDKHISFSLMGKSVPFDFDALGQSMEVDRYFRGDIFFQSSIHQIQGGPDGDGGDRNSH